MMQEAMALFKRLNVVCSNVQIKNMMGRVFIIAAGMAYDLAPILYQQTKKKKNQPAEAGKFLSSAVFPTIRLRNFNAVF